LTRQLEKDSDDEDITVFKCKICNNKGKFKEGAYVCDSCKYVVHKGCAEKRKKKKKRRRMTKL